jgi:hypothetical protein
MSERMAVESESTKVSRSSKGTSHRFIQVELLQGSLVESTRCLVAVVLALARAR